MKKDQYTLTASDGIHLHAVSWQPNEDSTKAVITLVHGMGEYIERYEYLAEKITSAGYAIVGYDHRGHGKSEGPRGHIPSYDQFLDDLQLAVDKTKDLFPDIPHLIYGHSMGGGLTANYLIRRQPQLKAAVLSAPYFRLKFKQPGIKIFMGRLTQNFVPKLTLPTGLDPNHISRDKSIVEKYKNDPLVHDKVSAKMGIAIMDAGEYAIAHAQEVHIPTFIIHGTGDLIVDPQGSKDFVANANPSLVSLKLYKGLYHEVHNDPEKDIVIQDVIDWMNSKL
ncbi:MAG: lysophospholipase [Chitinophagales bacterium]|nr:lysophospholipase [Chitinophagales bacterium]